MREVIESVRYSAAPGKHRIYIIDEVHMLSTAAFNALLKTLEEPPPRSLFVFATTNPEKIPFTVLSRCQRHDLRRIALASVTDRLAEICASEGIEISGSALSAIAREGDGSMRDAQTLLDQIVAYAGQTGEGSSALATISDETLAEVLDLVDHRVVRGIIETCIDSDPKAALEFVAQATSGGSEPRRIADALLSVLRDLTVLRIAPDGRDLFEGTDEERTELIELAGKTEPARLRRMFRALVREIEDLSWAPQPAAVLEMAVIRLATLPAGDDVAQLLARLDQLERRLAGGGPAHGSGGAGNTGGRRAAGNGSAPKAPARNRSEARGAERRTQSPAARNATTRAVAASDNTPAVSTNRPAPPEPDGFDTPPDARNQARSKQADPALSGGMPSREAPSSGGAPSNRGAPSNGGTPLGGGAPAAAIFDRFRTRALDVDRARFASLDSSELLGIRGNTIELGVPGRFHADRLLDRTPELEALASELFGQPARISLEIVDGKTAREESHEARETSRRRRQEALNSEPVNLALEVLEAEIVEIRPLGESR
jgi:DNA polymerase-3 subunit gamma/tau